jgi:LAS superfamily LD-carboxypeptidase LdcB
MAIDHGLARFAVGGATRPDSFTGMQPEFSSALARMFEAAPAETRAATRVGSGYRSEALQAKLFEDAVRKYGSPEKARKWVALLVNQTMGSEMPAI